MRQPRTIHDFYGFPQELFDIRYVAPGAQLAPLRESGVLILGRGNVVHNLGRIDPREAARGFDWAEPLDAAARLLFLEDPSAITRLAEHPDFRAAVPTPDHFIPLLYVAGLAGADPQSAEVLLDGYVHGSLSMTSYVFGGQAAGVDSSGTQEPPLFPDVDPEDTNL